MKRPSQLNLRAPDAVIDYLNRRIFFSCLAVALLAIQPSAIVAAGMERKIAPTQQVIAEGRHQYMMRCARCHGQKGDGNGPLADILDPRPRDFTLGMFKFRTTKTGALPTDEDLFRTISRGIPGTAMPSWEQTLPAEYRWALVYYIKTFSQDFADLESDPYKAVVSLSPKVVSSPESIARGQVLYEKNKCWECHGRQARGDGRTNLKDDWGFPTRVANLTRAWNLRGGSDPQDIVYRFTTGLNGTAMPSYADSILGEDRWHLANYIASIAKSDFDQEMLFKAMWTTEDIPRDVDAQLWRTLTPTTIFLNEQTLMEPFWINNAIDMLHVRAIYNEKEIGFLIEWDDPVQDSDHHQEREATRFQDRYVKAVGEIPRQPGVFRDAMALQFPVASSLDSKAPPYGGSPQDPVNLWVWKSDLAAKNETAVEDSNSWGFGSPIQPQLANAQQVRATASWHDGRWSVVMVRPLKTHDSNDVQFEKDQIIPVAFYGWDGSNGEHGSIMGLSPWHLVYLDDPDKDLFERMQKMLWFFGVSREFSPQ